MMLAELSIWPMDQGESVSKHVARVVEIIAQSGLSYQLGPLGTVIEGDVDDVFELLRACHEELEVDSNRVMCVIKTDFRRGREGGIESKVQSVEDKLAASPAPLPPGLATETQASAPSAEPQAWMRLVSDDDAEREPDQKS